MPIKSKLNHVIYLCLGPDYASHDVARRNFNETETIPPSIDVKIPHISTCPSSLRCLSFTCLTISLAFPLVGIYLIE